MTTNGMIAFWATVAVLAFGALAALVFSTEIWRWLNHG